MLVVFWSGLITFLSDLKSLGVQIPNQMLIILLFSFSHVLWKPPVVFLVIFW